MLSSLNIMEVFRCASVVKLRSGHRDQCLWQDDDHLSVAQKRDQVNPAQLDKTLLWKVELVDQPGDDDHEVAGGNTAPTIRLKSENGFYLKASERRFLLGATGRKVTQEVILSRVDASCEWEPSEVINDNIAGSSNAGGVGDGDEQSRFVKLRSKRYSTFLRANGGLPPYTNTVTHDVPWLGNTQKSIIWEVEVVEFRIKKLASSILPPLRIFVSNSYHLSKFVA